MIYTEKMWCLSWKSWQNGLFECSEFQWTKFTPNLLLELNRYWAKVMVFWNAGAIGFQMVGLEKECCTQKMVFFWHFHQKCTCSWIFRKTWFFGNGLFSLGNVVCDKFWNSLRRLYCPCGDFHRKKCLNKFQDYFLWSVKDTHDEKF